MLNRFKLRAWRARAVDLGSWLVQVLRTYRTDVVQY